MTTTQAAPSSRTLSPRRRTRLVQPERFPLLFIGAHVFLGAVIGESALVSTLHAWITIGYGLWLAWTSTDLTRVAAAAGYISMCDVLWRTTNAHAPWELPKYAFTAVLLIGLFKTVRQFRNSTLPIVFVAVLLPSIVLTVDHFGLSGSKNPLSFYLSGDVALAVSALFFLQLRANWADLRRILLAMVAPAVTLAVVVALGIVTATSLTFGTESNSSTSGGFGPNQVSNLLSAGALVCLILALHDRRLGTRVIEIAFGLYLFGQSVLTFSRGGGFSLVIAGGLALLAHLLQGHRRGRTALAAVVLLLLGMTVFSQLNGYTNGALDDRFSETSTTGRSEIAGLDMQLWYSHKIAGVGPGMARYERPGGSHWAGRPAHTEFTRLLAEHGTLGLVALLTMGFMLLGAVLRARSAMARSVALALPAWALVTMSHSDMRIAVISFMFGLGLVHLGEAKQDASSVTA